MKKKKLAFISNMASPYQVRFCYALQEYFDAEFWFYVRRESDRPKWWEIPLGDKCKIMKYSGKIGSNYFSFGLFAELNRFKPDVILLGGYMKWHWLVLRYAKISGIKVAFMTEALRSKVSDDDDSDKMMTRENSQRKIKAISTIFGGADLYIGMGDSSEKQLIDEFYFPLEKIGNLQYPTDIDAYFEHPLRDKKKGDHFKILFANRLIGRYQPLYALEIFKKLNEKYQNISMEMNRDGPLRQECEEYIKENNLRNVSFLREIESWDDMANIYRDSDIIILPATYSNGNISLVEGGASGMGVVMSNKVNNMSDSFKDGENCFICSVDIDEFVEAIEKYIENPELLISHANKSRELLEAERNYSIARTYYELFSRHKLI